MKETKTKIKKKNFLIVLLIFLAVFLLCLYFYDLGKEKVTFDLVIREYGIWNRTIDAEYYWNEGNGITEITPKY